MRILIITGSFPPDTCGVGDYTRSLADAIRSKGIEVTVYNPVKRGWRNLFDQNFMSPFDLIHLQYPTVGFGASLLPHLLFITTHKKKIITLHEFTQVHILRKLSINLFKLTKKASFIFTNNFEMQAFRLGPARVRTIPIGSNIKAFDGCVEKTRRIINFGLIRPDKGIEDFIELSRIFRNSGNTKFSFMLCGATDYRFQDFYNFIMSQCRDLNIETAMNLPEKDVARLMCESSFSYLPFPDGASDRRGSMLAAMINDCLVLTTLGAHTEPALKKSIIPVSTANDAYKKITEISPEEIKEKLKNSREYLKKFDWNTVADQHIEIYKEVSEE